MPTQKQRVDLAGLFQSVTQSLAENQPQLDRLDEYNHDHGNNMVQTFQTITTALEKKKGSSDGAALAYAARQLSRTANSSSSKLYAENLAQAATQFKGKQVDSKGALELLSTLIGAGQTQPSSGQSQSQSVAGADALGALLGGMGGTAGAQQPTQPQTSGGNDLLGALLGGLTGSGATQQPSQSSGADDLLGSLLGGMGGSSTSQQPSSGSGDLLGSLLGGLTGQSTGQQSNQSSGIGLDDLLAAGMAYMQAKQSGQGNTQALLQAFLAGSGMGSSTHRQESTQVVVQSFLQALSGMNTGR